MNGQTLTHEELFKACGAAVQQWAVELSKRLDAESAGKLLVAAALPVLMTVYGNGGAADFLRTLAAEIEKDAPSVN